MSTETYADAAYGQSSILPEDNGGSHAPGSQPAHFNHGRDGGDTIDPSRQPDEIVPDEGDTDIPGQTPDEVAPDQGDFDRPDSAPVELPPQPGSMPGETPPPD